MTAVLAWVRLDAVRRWRSLLVLAILVAITSAAVLAVVAGERRGSTSLERVLARTNPATMAVLPNQPGFDWAAVRALPEVESLGTFVLSGNYRIKELPGFEDGMFPLGDASVTRDLETPVVLSGRLFDQARADEVVATPTFLDTFDLAVGDQLTLQLPTPEEFAAQVGPANVAGGGAEQRATIVGTIRSPWFADQAGGEGTIVPTFGFTEKYHDVLLGRPDQGVENALVRLRNGQADILQFRTDLAQVSGRTDIDTWDLIGQAQAEAAHTIGFEGRALLLFGLTVLVAGAVLLGQAVARTASAAVSELAVMRALGLTHRQILAVASLPTAAAGMLGAAVGAVLSVLASSIFPFASARVIETEFGVSVDWWVLGVGTLLTVIAVVGGCIGTAALALRRGSSRRPAPASAVARAAARMGLPPAVVVGSRFALEPGRGAASVPVRPALLGAVTGVLGVLAALTFQVGASDAVGDLNRFGQTFEASAFIGIGGDDGAPADDVRRALEGVAADPRVAAVTDTRLAELQVAGRPVTTYAGADLGPTPLPRVVTAGRLPAAADEIALGPTVAKDLGVDVGATVHAVGTGPDAQGDLVVTGIAFVPEGPHNTYSDGAWTTVGAFDRFFPADAAHPGGNFKFHFALVGFRDGVDAAATRADLTAAIPDGPSFDPPTVPQEVRDLQAVQGLPLFLAGFLLLLAVAAVGHALATAVRRRRHDLAVLRALGFTRGQCRTTVLTQASVIAAIGLLIGLPLGVALGRTVWRLVADNTPVLYVPPLALVALLVAVPVALVAANVLAALPGRRAARLAVGPILRAE